MSVDSGPTAPVASAPPIEGQPAGQQLGESETALTDYLRRMRRQRKVYIAVLAALAVLVLIVVQVVLRTGEISHASLHPAKAAVPGPTADSPNDTVTQAWHSTDATAGGVPFSNGTVITYDQHTMTGRNYATGAAVWTYTRTDVSICTAFQEGGKAIAIYRDRDGFCDEISAFDAGTGARSWFRTLDSNGNTVTGKEVITVSTYTILITTPRYVQAVDTGGGIDRWTFIEPSTCTTTSAVWGSGGALIGQHCGDGDHLILRSAYDGDDDQNKNKPIKWRLEDTNVIAASADELIAAIDPNTKQLVQYSAANGKVLGRQALTPAPALDQSISAISGQTSELITVGRTTYSIDSTGGQQQWAQTYPGSPSWEGSPLYVIDAKGISRVDGETGKVQQTYAVPAPPAGSTAYQLGSGFVVSGTSTTVYH